MYSEELKSEPQREFIRIKAILSGMLAMFRDIATRRMKEYIRLTVSPGELASDSPATRFWEAAARLSGFFPESQIWA